MRQLAWSAVVLLGLSFSTSAVEPVQTLSFESCARVDVDASGRAHVVDMGEVTKLGDIPALKPVAGTISSRLREAIESWQFIPATREGVAVSSRTNVNISLEAYDDGKGGVAMRIRDAHTGASLRPVDKLPLSIAATSAQAEGFVKLDLAFDASGHVTDAKISDSKELWNGKYLGFADKKLRKGALAAALAWSIEPEVVDGQPQAGSGSVSVVFCLEDACDQVPLPRDPHAAADPQQFAATDPAVKLRTAVAGTAL